ncbi:MAG: electron transporter RnfB [Bacilli bacterium]|jgi:electron transport complex protein RnfB|nr:electron transporter RnfB [Bacilli bacterium]MCH4210258.1 electron transporter RnfB [Bacilli bacterium]MCH4228210.1 electron transporter RnfB [Bacilli bacterium]MCH4277436.1 electron transporter RnfB [Bacilli bacterium]MCI2054662.1 electron transporter RnfB [Bacilli bacterium]
MDYLYILYGLLILAGLGLLFGVVLVLAEKFFHVEEDPRIAAVEKMLPNANCGACGFAGCHAMAEALVTGECKKVSTCKVGKKEKNYDPIIAYLAEHPDKDGNKHVPTL